MADKVVKKIHIELQPTLTGKMIDVSMRSVDFESLTQNQRDTIKRNASRKRASHGWRHFTFRMELWDIMRSQLDCFSK